MLHSTMGVCVEQYRASIGLFNCLRFIRCPLTLNPCFRTSTNHRYIYRLAYILRFFSILFFCCILLKSWDIEPNPGPVQSKGKTLAVCHWNLNSLWVDNFVKVALLSAFLSTHDFDVLCLSETFLDSSITDDDPRLSINGYKLFRRDHPSNTKQGGVCIYYKDYLPLVERVDLTDLYECLVCEIKFGRNHLFLTTLYRSPSQSADQFSSFKQQFEETINKINNCAPSISLFLGDYNARNSQWFGNDITTIAGKDLASLTEMYGLVQVIDEPTHILSGSSSCRSQITDYGVLPSLFSRCHHQIVFAKLNFRVFYPPVYERRTVFEIFRRLITRL